MKLRSHALLTKDFKKRWYSYWAQEMKQDEAHLDHHQLRANKFWQNAVICQALAERGVIYAGSRGIGFGVGNERVPAALAKAGATILATDQDYRTKKAAYWSKHELATGLASLNKLQICDDEIFRQRVAYQPLDMKKIPHKLHGSFNFLWSNCALGHLGSITAGLDFIENSLACLQPGGWAVHTTEVNVLSDADTLTSGSTVIFRLSDLYGLFDKLEKQGYVCEPIQFDLGSTEQDLRLSLHPEFGNDFSKIQVGGYLATQIVLLIHKPKRVRKSSYRKRTLSSSYKKNLEQIQRFKGRQPIQDFFRRAALSPDQITLVPKRKNLSITVASGNTVQCLIEYTNHSEANLFAINYHLKEHHPIVLATTAPHDRQSQFSHTSWFGKGKNRPGPMINIKDGRLYTSCNYIQPGETFAFPITLSAYRAKPGNYKEEFEIVQEQAGWIAGSNISINVKVSPQTSSKS